MLNNILTIQELEEVRLYVKEQSKKLKKEGSTTAGVPGFQTPYAFSGEESGDGTSSIKLTDPQYSFSIKAPKKKKHFVGKLEEVSYKNFKEDVSTNEVQKVNSKILEVNKMLGEISRYLDHSLKLKQESKLDNTKYWKRTNEAILKISKRLAEVNKKAKKLANLKELEASSIKDKITRLFNKAGLKVQPKDVNYNKVGTDKYEIDILLFGEPQGIDYKAGELLYQDYDKEVRLGNIKQEIELIKKIAQTFKA